MHFGTTHSFELTTTGIGGLVQAADALPVVHLYANGVYISASTVSNLGSGRYGVVSAIPASAAGKYIQWLVTWTCDTLVRHRVINGGFHSIDSITTGQSVTILFVTVNQMGVKQDDDTATPTVRMLKNGAASSAITVTRLSSALYTATAVMPTLVLGDSIQLSRSCACDTLVLDATIFYDVCGQGELSSSMLNSPAEILRASLIVGSLGVLISTSPTGAWPIFVSHMPDTPDNVMCVYDTAGIKDGRLMRTGRTIKHHGWQVRVRAIEYDDGFVKIVMVADWLDTVLRETIVISGITYVIQSITQTSGPFAIGQEPEAKRREAFTLNGTMTLQSAA